MTFPPLQNLNVSMLDISQRTDSGMSCLLKSSGLAELSYPIDLLAYLFLYFLLRRWTQKRRSAIHEDVAVHGAALSCQSAVFP